MDWREPHMWLVGLCFAAIVGCLFMMVESNKAWQQFKAEHKCVVVGKMDVKDSVSLPSPQDLKPSRKSIDEMVEPSVGLPLWR